MDTKVASLHTSNNQQYFPPVVSVVGHVDHGKTTLLDKLRSTDIAAGEHGGITQRIGASQIEIEHEKTKRKITFIDTPGHEAFMNMRSYGVSASDIALLVVASDDGVMPQTKESIALLTKSKLPFIVVFTKKDSPAAAIEKIKQQVIREGILLEGLGGDVPYIAVSAKTGEGIKELLDLILLSYDLKQIQKDATKPFMGIVIESKRDKKKGVLTTIVVKQGTLKQGDKIFLHSEVGKVKALIAPHGEQVKQILPGDAAAILGISDILATGSIISSHPTKETVQLTKSSPPLPSLPAMKFEDFFNDTKKATVKIVLKTETSAEAEAIKQALPPEIVVVAEGQGDIVVSDIMMAKETSSIVIGFNTKITPDAKTVSETEHILYRSYSIIYELLDELQDVLLMAQERLTEKIYGKASIQAIFGSEASKIAGVKVLEGRLKRGDTVRIMRGTLEIADTIIGTLKRGKADVKEVAKGLECGVGFAAQVDFLVGDAIIAYSK